jgi:hypothetical protein
MPTCCINWPQPWRIIASRYPPIRLFERLNADTAVWDALIALEQLTNPRVRDEVGGLKGLAPPRDVVRPPYRPEPWPRPAPAPRRGSAAANGCRALGTT